MAQTLLRAIIIRAENPERAAAFYIALGLAFTKPSETSASYFLKQGEITLEIQAGLAQGARLQIEVANLDSAISGAGKFGGRLDGRPKTSSTGRRAVMLDPAGNRVDLVEIP
jgi:predicted enzyme related to lactoylglutathione lyase